MKLQHMQDRGDEKYATQFTVDRAAQKRRLARHVFIANCFPCIVAEKTTVLTLLRDFLRSVAMPVTLHLLVLSLGVVKECLNMRQRNAYLHKVYTIMETCVACVEVIMQVAFITTLYAETRKINMHSISTSTVTASDSGASSRFQKGVATWVKVYVVFASLLVVFMATSYFVFLYTVHHGWTVLSNNACLIVITASTIIHQRRLTRQSMQLREDEHKLALCEAFHLLDESHMGRKDVYVRADVFKGELASSPLFTVPDYIHLSEDRMRTPTGNVTNEVV